MKKTLLILCALLCLVGTKAWAQTTVTIADFSNLPTTYGSFSEGVFTTNDASGYAGVTISAESGVTLGSTYVNQDYGNCFSIVTSSTSAYTITLSAPEGYVIGGYQIGASANSANNKHTLSANGSTLEVSSYGYVGAFQYFTQEGLNAQNAEFTIQTANGGNTLYIAYFQVQLVSASKATVYTYNVDYNSANKNKQETFTLTQEKGGTPTIASSFKYGGNVDFVEYSYSVETLPDAAATITTTANWTGPFDFSSSYDDATWYYMTIRTTKYVTYQESAPYPLSTTKTLAPAGCWAFLGNPFDGVQVINKAAGSENYLQATATQPSMTTTATNWQIVNNGGNFILYNASYGYINDAAQENYLKYWNNSLGATDDGSTFRVEPVVLTYTIGETDGTYYNSEGGAITKGISGWGPTWKSDATYGGSPILTFADDNSVKTGMSSANAHIYTASEGAARRYLMTAANGYIISGYTVNGTATNTDITVLPRLRTSTTISQGETSASDISVEGLNAAQASFTISGSAQGSLENPTIKVTLVPAAFEAYSPDLADQTIAHFGFISNDGGSRPMPYISATGTQAQSSASTSGATVNAPADAALFELEVDENAHASYLKVYGTSNYLYALDVTMSSLTGVGSNTQALGVGALPSGDKSMYQWVIEEKGTQSEATYYAIRPKLNTNTAIAVYSTTGTTLTFYSVHNNAEYGFSHAFLNNTTWAQKADWYYNQCGRSAYVQRAGKVGYPSTDNTSYTQFMSALQTCATTPSQDAYDNLVSKYTAYETDVNIVKPTAGHFYRIQSSAKSQSAQPYLVGVNSTYSGKTDRAAYDTEAGSSTSSIWCYTTDTEGNENLVNYGNGGYVATLSSNNISNTSNASATAAIITGITKPTGNLAEMGAVNIKFASNRYLYTGAATSGDVTYYYTDSGTNLDAIGYNFNIEEVTELPVTISAAGYATFNCPVAVDIPTGITAFQAKINEDGTKIQLVSIDDGVIPANFPVVLRGAANTYNFAINTSTTLTAGDYHSNALVGSVAAESITDASRYTLQKTSGGSGVGFYLNQGTSFKGFSAYLSKETGSQIRGFVIEDTTTGIKTFESIDADANVFDLQGRRVNSATKGLYIVNGKKVLY